MPPTTTIADRAALRFADLPRYFLWRDVLSCFDGDEASFTDAWVAGTLPPAVRQVCLEQMPDGLLQLYLLARMCRSLDRLIQVLQEGDLTVFEPPAGPRAQ